MASFTLTITTNSSSGEKESVVRTKDPAVVHDEMKKFFGELNIAGNDFVQISILKQ